MSRQPQKSALKSALKSQIESFELNSEQLSKLESLQQQSEQKAAADRKPNRDDTSSSSKPGKTSRFNSAKIAWAAIFALAAINLFWLFPAYQSRVGTHTTVAESEKINMVAAEVVRNHLNRKPLEIVKTEEQQILAYFTKLDFRPVKSDYLETLAFAPVGGRYCSLQSRRAAFISYKSKTDDQSHTVYQAPYDAAVFPILPNVDAGETPLVTWSGGVKVTLWVEKGLLFAMTD